jgi:hypothetical protein
MRGCSGIKPRGRWVRAVWRRSQRSPSSTSSVATASDVGRSRQAPPPENAVPCGRDAEDRRSCAEVPGARSAQWAVIRRMELLLLCVACDREPGLSIGHALRRRCCDAEGVSHGHRRDTRSLLLAEVRCQSQLFIQPNIGRRPSRKCLGPALRAAAVNARRTGRRVAVNTRSGVRASHIPPTTLSRSRFTIAGIRCTAKRFGCGAACGMAAMSGSASRTRPRFRCG